MSIKLTIEKRIGLLFGLVSDPRRKMMNERETDATPAGFLAQRSTGTLASVSIEGTPQAATVFYVVDRPESFVFKSRSGSDHMQDLFRAPSAAFAIYDHNSTYELKSGLQLKGHVSRIESTEDMTRCVDLYSNRFDGARQKFGPVQDLVAFDAPSTLYRYQIVQYKFTHGQTDRVDVEFSEWGSGPAG